MPSLPDIGRRVAKHRKDHAVVLDYDGVLSEPGFSPAIGLVDAYHEAGHVDGAAMDQFYEILEEQDITRDREFEGSLLSVATQGLEGTDKGALRSTTSDYVAEHRDEILTADANDFLAEQQKRGRDVFIVSNNYRVFFDALADRSNININNVYSNVLAVAEGTDNGNTLTGTLSDNVFMAGKDEVVKEIERDRKRYIYAAIGDSVSDFPMLERAEHGYGVNTTADFRDNMAAHWQVHDDITGVAADLREKDERHLLHRWFDI